MNICRLCPRECSVDRRVKKGFCHESDTVRIARADLHMWEEPCISGDSGSGAVFFSGCTLGCVFCQNHKISHESVGSEISDEKLADVFLMLEQKGAHNINLVNPTHFTDNILSALDKVRHRLGIPVVWNSGGYERAETIKRLLGYVDIFLPDFKFASSELSMRYSGVRDYCDIALRAILQMKENVGYPVFSSDGLMKSGFLIRHLVLPSGMHDSMRVLDIISQNFDTERVHLSLMCQFFPAYKAATFPELSRKLTTLEYQRVLEYSEKLGLVHGYRQMKDSAKDSFVPEFYSNLSDILS